MQIIDQNVKEAVVGDTEIYFAAIGNVIDFFRGKRQNKIKFITINETKQQPESYIIIDSKKFDDL